MPVAPKKLAMTSSRTTPRMRLVMVAAAADAAERASLEDEPDSGAKLAADNLVDGLPVGILPGQHRHDRLHHLAHVLRRCRAGFRDGRAYRRLDLLCARRWRQVLLEHRDFAGFLGDEIGAAGLRELLDGIAPLLTRGGETRRTSAASGSGP